MSPQAWKSFWTAVLIVWILIGFGLLWLSEAADARCHTKACHARVHDKRVAAWLKRERPAVYYFRLQAPAWKTWVFRTASCETGPRAQTSARFPWGPPKWDIDSEYDGGLQFSPRTWFAAMRYVPRSLHTRRLPYGVRWEHQGVVAIALAQAEGTRHWPVCG